MTDDKGAALVVDGLCKRYGGEMVLDRIGFSIAEGEVLALLGHSGSGKTTTLRLIAGLEVPDAGEISLFGRRVERLPARERNLGVIFQNYALFPRMTVAENIAFGLRIRGISRADRDRVVADLLGMIGLVEQREKYPSQLSGGQQQRVAIARALAYRPAMLLFDEPFSALDPRTRAGLRREIRSLLRKLRVPALFITHDQEEAMELGDQLAILNRGHLEQIGTPEEVYSQPCTEFVARFLGAANIVDVVISGERIILPGERWLPLPAGMPLAAIAGSPRLVFRPEEVELGGTPRLSLGVGRVVEISFSGPVEWLTIALDGLSEGQILIKACRTRWESGSCRPSQGDLLPIGLKSFRVLGE